MAEKWKKRGVVAGLLLPLIVILFSLGGVPDAAVDGDLALLELSTRQTAAGHNLLGPYSRFYFNHPGPGYFLLMLPFYSLCSQSHGSFFLGAIFLNLAAVLIIYRVVRPQPWPVVLCSGILLSLWLLFLGPEKWFSAWNPDISILIFGASLFSLAAGAAGRIGYLFAGLFLASLAVQTHLVYAVSAGLAVSAALLILVFPGSVGLQKRGRGWPAWGGGLAFLAVLWAPALAEEISSNDGNLSRIYSFLSLPHSRKPLAETLEVIGSKAVGFLVDLFPLQSGGTGVLGLLVGGLLVAFLSSRRRGEALSVSLSLVTLAGLAGATLSVRRIVGPVHGYLVEWIGMLGLAGLAAILMSLADPIGRLNGRIRRIATAFLAVSFVLTAMMNLKAAWSPQRLEGWPDAPKHRNIVRLADLTRTALRQSGIHHPEVRIATSSSWPTAAGVLLRLNKAQITFCVEKDWLFLFGRGWSCKRPADALLIFGDLQFNSEVAEDPRFERIGEWDEGGIFLSKGPPMTKTVDFSAAESVLYLDQGFARLLHVQKGQGRWSLGPFSSLTLPLEEGRNFSLEVTALPLGIPGRVQTIRLLLNGSRLTEFPLVERELTYRVPLPAEHVRNVNEVRFEYAYAEPPMLHLQESTDWRSLGVFFREIKIVPVIGIE